jgi:hypothetical protein
MVWLVRRELAAVRTFRGGRRQHPYALDNAATDSTPAIVINVAVTASTMPNPRSLLEFRI